MTRVAIIAALWREVAPLLRSSRIRWQRDANLHPKGVAVWCSADAVVSYAGMGERCASLAVEAALATGPISEIISVGWAGACQPGALVGSIARPSTIVNAQTGERYSCVAGDGSVLATVAAFAGSEEKLRLQAAYGASVLEMEAATVARLAQAHGLPFRAIKAISDAADFDFPAIARFHTVDGQFREAAFAAYAACRPWLWKPVLQMAQGSKLAAESLCAEIDLQIQHSRK
jgi:adenosylhomocysteine nucleosidase